MRSASIADGRPRTVSYVSDFLGQVIRRDEADALAGGDPHEIWYRMSGRQRAYVGNNGTIDVDYRASVRQKQQGGPVLATSYLGLIRREWNRFYRDVPAPTRQQLFDKATEIDMNYGHLFSPQVGW